MSELNREFVKYWASKYDDDYKEKYAKLEREIKEWLATQPEPKYFDKEHFVKLGKWKTPRQERNYKNNDENLVQEATRLAYEVSDERLKLHILTVLRGVRVPVASTLLHFMHPDKFPIFDVRARSSLEELSEWNKSTNDSSQEAWLEYVHITYYERNLKEIGYEFA